MQKAMFSSPFAALDSTERRIKLLNTKPDISADEIVEVSHLARIIHEKSPTVIRSLL
jgi:hypothetical protein